MDISIVKTVAMRGIETAPLVRIIREGGQERRLKEKSQTEILHEIREDHMYVANKSLNDNRDYGDVLLRCGSTNEIKRTPGLIYAIWTSPHLGKTPKHKPPQITSKAEPEDQDEVILPDANEIQKVFQNMLDMTSLFSLNENEDTTDSEAEDEVDFENEPVIGADILNTAETAVPGTIHNVSKVNSMEDVLGKNSENEKNDATKDGTEMNGSDNSTAANGNEAASCSSHDTDKKTARHQRQLQKRSSKNKSVTNVTPTDGGITTNKSKNDNLQNKIYSNGKEESAKEENAHKVSCKTVDEKEWRETSRKIEETRYAGAKIERITRQLVRHWEDFVTMTTEEVRQCEMQNAREIGMVAEVVDMLEDTGRYVWQLIDELIFV